MGSTREIPGGSPPRRQKIFGFPVSAARRDEIVALLLRPVPQGAGLRTLITANLDHIVTLRQNARFRSAYDSAWLITADGVPVYVYSRLVGLGVREKVSGSDLFVDLLPQLEPGVHRPAFLLPSEPTERWLDEELRRRGFERDQFFCEIPPFAFETDPVYSAALADKIRACAPTHIFLCLGAPKSEIWATDNLDDVGDAYVLPIGASVEFAAKLKRRAPRWVSDFGFEWLWRLASEPKRLVYRYLVRSWGFLPAIMADFISRGERVTIRARVGPAHVSQGPAGTGSCST